MNHYLSMNGAERKIELEKLSAELAEVRSLGLRLDMSRGKPSPRQLDLVTEIFSKVDYTEYLSEEGMDCRNYGGLYGIREMRRIFAGMLQTDIERVWCLGSSSLNIEYDILARCLLFPLPGQEKSWFGTKTRFICPVPGYDRHFAMLEQFGIEMVPVPLLADGPDMDKVEALCAADSTIKGMWIVPLYSNPDGTVYSEACLRRLFRMQAAGDFRIFADMAYCVHHLSDVKQQQASIPELLSLAEEEGNPDRVWVFTSTSKITYAGAGVACVAMSSRNQEWVLPSLSSQMIGADKLSQLRHARFFALAGGVERVMSMHADSLRVKFSAALAVLDAGLKPAGIADWKSPHGGYFISVNLFPGTALQTVALCKELGVHLTAAGSTYPYGNDVADSNVRIAPSYPELPELEQAMRIFCLASRYVALQKLEE